jgi:hypothetical protein
MNTERPDVGFQTVGHVVGWSARPSGQGTVRQPSDLHCRRVLAESSFCSSLSNLRIPFKGRHLCLNVRRRYSEHDNQQ